MFDYFQRPGLEEDTLMALLSTCIYLIMVWLGHKLPLDTPSVSLWVSDYINVLFIFPVF